MNISFVTSVQLVNGVMYIYTIFAIHHYYSTVLNNIYMYMTLCNNKVIIIIILLKNFKCVL